MRILKYKRAMCIVSIYTHEMVQYTVPIHTNERVIHIVTVYECNRVTYTVHLHKYKIVANMYIRLVWGSYE